MLTFFFTFYYSTAVYTFNKMSNWRKCVFGCEKPRTFFSLPKEGPNRQKWVDFITKKYLQKEQLVFVCDGHFADECLVNLGLYNSGLSQRLILKSGAIPTIKPANVEPGAGTSQEAVPSVTAPTMSRGVQTPITTSFYRSVSTQLSEGTLKAVHVRSKAVQVTSAALDVNVERQHHWRDLSSERIKALQSKAEQRRSKRPHLEEEEEEDAEDMDTADVPYDESRPEPLTCMTDTSEMIEMENADLEDTKYIVFESSLKELFDTCPVCLHPCVIQRRKCGTFVSFAQDCPHCLYSRTWQSGPVVGSTPVSDLQLSAAVYFSGGSFAKVKRICKAMNLQIHQHNTFRRHSRSFLEPAIYYKWRGDQKRFLEELKSKGKIAISGDMAADSPGHSAKYGSYNVTELQSNKILDMQLVQSSAVGGRKHMEKEGLCRSLDFVKANGLQLDYVVTDYHPQIQKCLNERNVTQYYDVWHRQKDLSKRLEKLSKVKECRALKKWSSAIKKQMHWAASSSRSVPERVAKWASIISHIKNDHTLEEASRIPKKPGTVALNKVKKLLLSKRVLRDVAHLSLAHQTSPEAFQRVIHHFEPKNVVSGGVRRMCRLYLAGMHHNENAKHEQASSKRKALFKVRRPKHKKGPFTAKPLKSKSTYGYVTALMRVVFNEVFPEPSKFVEQFRTAVPL